MNIRISPWRTVVENTEITSTGKLQFAFRNAAYEAEKANNTEHHDALKLLSSLCSMYIKTESLVEPFGPMMTNGPHHTLIPDDLSETELDALETLLPDVDNHWLRARLADTLWARRRNREHALAALESYRYLINPKVENEYERRDMYTRALIIARTLDRPTCSEMVDELVSKFLNEENNAVSNQLEVFDLVVAYLGAVDNKEEVLQKLIQLGANAEVDGDGYSARCCFELARKEFRKERRHSDDHAMTHRIADNYVQQHTKLKDTPNSQSSSAMFVRSGVEEYIQLPREYRVLHGIEQRIVDLRKELGRVDLSVVKNMASISSNDINLAPMVRDIEDRVRGLPLDQALVRYCDTAYQENVDSTREMARRLVQEHPVQHLIRRITYASDGRVVAQGTTLDFNDPESLVTVSQEEAVRQFGSLCSITVVGSIIPGLQVFQDEHHISLRLCQRMVGQAWLVPPNRVNSWARGLHHGFTGSIIDAVLTLIPQLEYWLRWLLNLEGHDTIVRESNGTDVQMGMESLLSHPAIKEMLEDGLWYEFNYYFLSEHGANLRNELLHSLTEDDEVNVNLLYAVWHLCLRVVVYSRLHRTETDVVA